MSLASSPFDQALELLFKELDPTHDLLITPTKRLSRFLVERHDLLESRESFESLNCLAYSAWLEQLWLDAQFLATAAGVERALLSPLQETLLWQQVVAGHAETPALINEQATAAQAQRAWSLLHDWELDRGQLVAFARAQGENEVFWKWVEDFEARCRRQAWICTAELAGQLARLAPELDKVCPRRVFHYGFDEFTPGQQRWLATLSGQGCDIREVVLEVDDTVVRQASFANESEQLQAAARWAAQCVEANPRQRIAVVVPDLAAQRARIERVFMREFEPQYMLPGRAQHATGFNVSAAQTLSGMPMITAALGALRCAEKYRGVGRRIDIDRMSALLHSPFLGLQAEREQRAQLDLMLREDSEPEVSFQQLKTLASGQAASGYCRDWYARLTRLGDLHRGSSAARFPSEWIPFWLDLLGAWGWPGDRPLDTLEYQQWQAWNDVLDELSGLDAVVGKLGFAAAVAALEQTLDARDFQARTLSSPVQILGLLEAAGLPFDAMWVLDLDDESWPPAARPNPLLPLSVQREKQLPQSSPEREYEFAERTQKRLQQCCPSIVASFATSRGDKAYSASPLVESWAPLDWQPPEAPDYRDILFASRDLEACLDLVGPPVTAVEGIRGGSQIIKSQSHCPFQAFARFRLHTNEVAEPGVGLSALERGKLLHHVLEVVWTLVQDHQQLTSLPEAALLDLIDRANEEAFAALKKRRLLGRRFIALEGQRLRDTVMTWLALEKRRAPFRVLSNEGRKTIHLETLPIHVRFDRVDELEDGSLFVLDYKTGHSSIRDWAGERPEEPQVPIYAVANAEQVSAAAFGQLASDDIGFKGLGRDKRLAPGLVDAEATGRMELPEGWEPILEHWQQVLNRLAREFLAGAAAVDPKDPASTCTYCELQALCRIREQRDADISRDPAAAEQGHD